MIKEITEADKIIDEMNNPKTALTHIEILLDILEKAKKFIENDTEMSEIEK